MEVLVLINFEGTMRDEMTVHAGDVVKKVTKASEEGWLEGELRGRRGIFPANFVKEVPVYLMGDSQREPRSIRTSRAAKRQIRKCEVTFAYSSSHEDELDLVVGETIEVLREIEDGWWMGKKNGKIGAFPSNFVKEIFASLKDTKLSEGKSRPKLSDAVFTKEPNQQQRASVRKKAGNAKERCQVMFDYTACTEDELSLKKGDIITIITKESEDDGWWEGELNGRKGFFPDNFVMVIPADALQGGNASQPPVRRGTEKHAVKQEAAGMDRNGTDPNVKADKKDEKPDSKDLRSDPPGKIKLPGMRKAPPPPVKEKTLKLVPKTDESHPTSPKQKESKEPEQFDTVDISPDKLSHPTANRAKPPQRRPPSALPTSPLDTSGEGHKEASAAEAGSPKKSSSPPKVTENRLPSMKMADQSAKLIAPLSPAAASLSDVQAEVRELRMSLELLKGLHERDMRELRDELKEERNKRMKLQEEIQTLRTSR